MRLLGGGTGAAPERDDDFEAELAALVLKHQGRAPPTSALVRVAQKKVEQFNKWGCTIRRGGRACTAPNRCGNWSLCTPSSAFEAELAALVLKVRPPTSVSM